LTKRELIEQIKELCEKLERPLSEAELKIIKSIASRDELIELRAKLELLLAFKEGKYE